LIEALGVELQRPPSDSAIRFFFGQVDVAALCAAIRDWTIAQIPAGSQLHPSTSADRGGWLIWVNGNWRLTC